MEILRKLLNHIFLLYKKLSLQSSKFLPLCISEHVGIEYPVFPSSASHVHPGISISVLIRSLLLRRCQLFSPNSEYLSCMVNSIWLINCFSTQPLPNRSAFLPVLCMQFFFTEYVAFHPYCTFNFTLVLGQQSQLCPFGKIFCLTCYASLVSMTRCRICSIFSTKATSINCILQFCSYPVNANTPPTIHSMHCSHHPSSQLFQAFSQHHVSLATACKIFKTCYSAFNNPFAESFKPFLTFLFCQRTSCCKLRIGSFVVKPVLSCQSLKLPGSSIVALPLLAA